MYRTIFVLGSLVILCVLLADSVQLVNNNFNEGEIHVDLAKACASKHCDRGEQCVRRKFWCKNPPCPNMLYCSKTSRESVKGPATCKSVQCSKGYVCLVKARRCRWDQKCKQQIARCVSEREYYDSPASCADFECPPRHKCILRESLCTYPPCKLLKSCAKAKDVQTWHSRCKTLGCPSEYECFLRKPPDDCSFIYPCKYVPDCTTANVNANSANPNCQGWICPKDQKCSAMVPESCKPENRTENCQIKRICQNPASKSTTSSSLFTTLIPPASTTATNLWDVSSEINTPKLHQNPTENYYRKVHHSNPPTTQKIESAFMNSKYPLNSSQRDANCNQNESIFRGKWRTQFEIWNPQSASIYRTPIYIRSTVKENITEAEEPLIQEKTIDRSITEWLDHLRLKTGVDAISVWKKHAEENKKFEQFKEWLESVKITLGPLRFQAWLKEFKKLISEYPDFRDWLAATENLFPLTEHHTNNPEKNVQLNKVPDPKTGKSSINVTDHEDPKTSKFLVSNGSRTDNVDEKFTWPYSGSGIGHNMEYGKELLQPENEHKKLFNSLSNSTQGHEPRNSTDLLELKRKIQNNPKSDDPGDHSLRFSDNRADKQLPKNVRNDSRQDDEKDLLKKNVTNVDQLLDPTNNASGKNYEDHDLASENNTHPITTPHTEIQNSSNLTNLHDSFAPITDELHTSSPWDVLRILDPKKKTYYAIISFPSEGDNDQVQIIGYPLFLSKIPSVEQSDSFAHNAKGLDEHSPFPDATPNVKSNLNQSEDTWSQIPHQIVPLITQNLNPTALGEIAPHVKAESSEQNRQINSTLQHGIQNNRLKQREHHPVISSNPPFKPYQSPNYKEVNWNMQDPKSYPPSNENVTAFPNSYIDDDLTSHSTVIRQDPSVTNPTISLENKSITHLGKSLKDYGNKSSLSSQEYVDAYLDALIEDAILKFILTEPLQNNETPEDLSPLSQDFYTTLDQVNFDDYYSHVGEEEPFNAVLLAKLLKNKVKNIFTDEKHDRILNIHRSIEPIEQTKDTLINGQQIVTFSTDSSTPSIKSENDYQYDCEDQNTKSTSTVKAIEENLELDSGNHGMEEYYYEDALEQEYPEEGFGFQDESVEIRLVNVTDFDN